MRILATLALWFAGCAYAALTAPASELIGKSVIDPARADLGRVHDLILDLREARVEYAVLGFGGWAGIFDKQFAIPIEKFTPAPYSDKLVLERAKDILLLEPGIDSTGLPDGEAEYWRGIDRWYERYDGRAPALRQYARASMLIGREVVDRTGEPIGELADFQIDLASGEVLDALLALEGDMRRVPLALLRVPSGREAIVYHTGDKP
ncbi:MAG TPA: PRC-barrel domain-containing protein [Burkholderiales bacterium]